MRLFLAIMVVLLVLLLIFAIQNPGSTEVSFITFTSAVSLLLIIVVSVAVGLLLGIAVMMPGKLRRSSQVRTLRSETGRLKSESADMAAAMDKDRREPVDTSSGDADTRRRDSTT